MDEEKCTCDSRARMDGLSDERVASAVDAMPEDYESWGVDIVSALPADELDCEEDRFYDDYCI